MALDPDHVLLQVEAHLLSVLGQDSGRAGVSFLGAERSGGIFAYDLSHRPGRAGFAGYLNTREADLAPEGVRFIPAADSPVRVPLVLVTNEISGTVSIIAVRPG